MVPKSKSLASLASIDRLRVVFKLLTAQLVRVVRSARQMKSLMIALSVTTAQLESINKLLAHLEHTEPVHA